MKLPDSLKNTELVTEKTNSNGNKILCLSDGINLPYGIECAQAVIINKKVYLLGGFKDGFCLSSVYSATINLDGKVKVWNLNDRLGVWKTDHNLPGPLADYEVEIVNNRLRLLGGYNGTNYVNTVYSAAINPNGTLGEWVLECNKTQDSVPHDNIEQLISKTNSNRIRLGRPGDDSIKITLSSNNDIKPPESTQSYDTQTINQILEIVKKLLTTKSTQKYIKPDNARQLKWDMRYLSLADNISSWSKDPSSKVGAIIVDTKNRIVSTGYNGYPNSLSDTQDTDPRELKYLKTIHAEENAILFSQKSIEGCTAYITHPPCPNCAIKLIQSGITRVVYYQPSEEFKKRWETAHQLSLELFKEANVKVNSYLNLNQ